MYNPMLSIAIATFPTMTVLYGTMILGFIAAVTLGSIAWYNSTRPPGWQDKERPNIIPKIK